VKSVIEAKVFKNGGSNAIRIPASFKLDAQVVYLSLDDEAGEIVISKSNPRPFSRLLALHETQGVISDSEWDIDRDRQDVQNRPSMQRLADMK